MNASPRLARAGAKTVALRASLVWHDEVMEDVVLEKPQVITIGASADGGGMRPAMAVLLKTPLFLVVLVLRLFFPNLLRQRSTVPTFVVPDIGLPAKFQIIKPGNRGYLLTLGEKMRGTICVDGKQQDVAEFLRNGGDSDSRGGFRATPISGRDWGVIELDDSGTYKLFFQFVPLEDAQPFFTKPVLYGLLAGYLLLIAGWAGFFLGKGIANSYIWHVDVHGTRVYAGYHYELLGSDLFYRVAEAVFRAWLVNTAVLGVCGLIWWLTRQDGEQQASFVFSAVLHAAVVFMTYRLAIDGDQFVWPGPRSMTGIYVVNRVDDKPPEPEKKTPSLQKNDGEQAEKSPEPPKKIATKGEEGKMGGEGKVERARTPKPNDSKAPPRVGLIQDKNRKVLDNIINPQAKMDYGSFAGIQGEPKRGDMGFGDGKGTGVGHGEGTGTTRNSHGKGTGGGGDSENDRISNHGKIDAGKASGGGNCATPPCGVSPKLVAVAASDIAGDFEGLTAEEINKVVRAHAGVFRACYQKELNRQPGLSGKLVMHFTIGGDGGVKSVKTAGGSNLRNDAIEECVNRQIMGLHFRAAGGISNVNYPFVFSQGG